MLLIDITHIEYLMCVEQLSRRVSSVARIVSHVKPARHGTCLNNEK